MSLEDLFQYLAFFNSISSLLFCKIINKVSTLLLGGTSIVFAVFYMDQPTGLLHIIHLKEVMWQVRRGGYSDNLLGRLCEFSF